VSIVFGHRLPTFDRHTQVRGLAENGPKIFFARDLAWWSLPSTIEHMLSSSVHAPVGLQATIDETRRTQGAHGIVDLIVAALTKGRLRRDADIDEHLAALKGACRQTRRYREALPVLHRVAEVKPDRRHEMAAEIALVHWHLGERGLAVATLESAIAQQRGLPAWKRSLGFSLVAEIAATVVGRSELAAECAQLGRSTVRPGPLRTRAQTAAHTVKPAADTAVESGDHTVAGAPSAAPTVGRRREKGPVRQLSVLSAADQSSLAEVGTGGGLTEANRPRLTLVGGTAA
jgi:hypothetical protein